MILRLMRAWRERRDEGGAALVTVVAVGAALIILVSTMVGFAVSGAKKTSSDQDWQNAMAAAYAGLADYQSKMTANNGYEVYGNSSAAFTANSTSNVTPLPSNVAFSTGAGGAWASVYGSTSESFRYEVDNSAYTSQGILKVRVTGRSGNTTRSLVADLRGDGFINYLYFTDYESSDPAITGERQQGDSSKLCTSQYLYNGYNPAVNCAPVQFQSGDQLYGPVRSNDEISTCGATFYQPVYTAYAPSPSTAATYRVPNGCSMPTKNFKSGVPQTVAPIDLPSTNTAMLQQARTNDPVNVPRPGCLYTGPTKVTFNSTGTMTIYSPWTRATEFSVASDGTVSGVTNTQCGSIAALHSASGATVPQLTANLMYVQNVPTSSTDPNYWASTSVPTWTGNGVSTFCQTVVNNNGQTSNTNGYGNGLGYPLANEYSPANSPSTTYGCRNGDVFASGTFSGTMTLAAQNDVWVTGNITYNDPSNDLLGLVGQNAVEIWNPIACSYATNNVCYTGQGYSTLLARSGGSSVTVDAAIASNDGTFQVENYAYGAQLGTLYVLGSIAQEWRGAVGVSYSTGYSSYTTGFTKSYLYDARFQNTAPPKFLQPVSTTYGITTQVEVPAAYSASGACVTSGGKCI